VAETRAERLQHFRSEIYGRVEGWLGDRMLQIVEVIGTIFHSNAVCGHIAEFGVHHGLFLFLLNALREDSEECFAIDVFDDQHLNVDYSGGEGPRIAGDLSLAYRNADAVAPPLFPDRAARHDELLDPRRSSICSARMASSSSRSMPATRSNTPAMTCRSRKRCWCRVGSSPSTIICQYTGAE
jgi:hypothetical protein